MTGRLGHRAGPAAWRVATFCPTCGDRTVIHLCAGRVAFVRRNNRPMQCDACGAEHARAVFWPTVTPIQPEDADTAPRTRRAPVPDVRADILAEFTRELRARACTPKTIAVMSSTLRTFGRWLPVPIEHATRDQIVEWLATPAWSPLTRRTYKTTLTSFYEWLTETGRIETSPTRRIRSVRVPYSEPDPLTTAQIQTLLDSGIRRRTRLMVLLAAYQGMRAAEIAACHTADIDTTAGTIRIPTGKGGTDLRRPLHPLVAAMLARVDPRPGYLFPGQNGNDHVTARSVSTALSIALRRAGIHGHRPHQLRAWHATELVRLGTDTVTIQHSMRHATLGALHKYVHPDAADIATAMHRLPSVDF